ncbi:ABC-2 transporter permease [Halosimplex salinum]|uniref:ABC transporter permease n=1 Tax=Halosimplex salinum TaxID=1710538 RepID=UPI000F4A5E0B|nr:ABC transporter permease [Halosimplex salinum]
MAAPGDRTDASERDHRRSGRSSPPDHTLGEADSALSVARRDLAALCRSKLLWATALVLVALAVAPVHDLLRRDILVETHYDVLRRAPGLYYVSVGAVAAAVGYAANGSSPATGASGRLRSRADAVREWTRRSGSRRAAAAVAALFLTVLAYVAVMRFGPNPVALATVALALTAYVAASSGPRLRGRATGRRAASGLPATGRTAFLGFALSRSAVLVALVLGTYLLQGALAFAELRAFEPVAYLATAGLLTVFTVMWAAIAVGFGALAATPGRAFAATLGVYVLADLTHFWHNTVSNVLGALVLGDAYVPTELTRLENPYSGDPWWVLYLGWLNPFDGFRGVSNWLAVELSSTHIVIDGEVREVTIGGDPVHVAYAVAVMLGWTAAFLAAGYYASGRSERA